MTHEKPANAPQDASGKGENMTTPLFILQNTNSINGINPRSSNPPAQEERTIPFPVTLITDPRIHESQFYQALSSQFPNMNMRWRPEDPTALYLFNGEMPIGKLHTGNNVYHPSMYEGRLTPNGPRKTLILRNYAREDHNQFPFDVQRFTIDVLCDHIFFKYREVERKLKERAEDLTVLTRYKINGLCEPEIAELEERLRPGKDSYAGFLGQTERLRDAIRADAKTLASHGIRHEYLGKILETLVDLAQTRFFQILRRYGVDAHFREQSNGVLVNGVHRVRVQGWCGYQYCPWCEIALKNYAGKDRISEDRLKRHITKYDYTLTNERNGTTIYFSGLLPHLIRDHHFFEGNTPYRLDPKAALECLELNKL